ncbi:unnamed protein product, partial [Protopolystoma xenopodis]
GYDWSSRSDHSRSGQSRAGPRPTVKHRDWPREGRPPTTGLSRGQWARSSVLLASTQSDASNCRAPRATLPPPPPHCLPLESEAQAAVLHSPWPTTPFSTPFSAPSAATIPTDRHTYTQTARQDRLSPLGISSPRPCESSSKKVDLILSSFASRRVNNLSSVQAGQFELRADSRDRVEQGVDQFVAAHASRVGGVSGLADVSEARHPIRTPTPGRTNRPIRTGRLNHHVLAGEAPEAILTK